MKNSLTSIFEKWLPIVEDGVLDPLRIADMHRRHLHSPSDTFMVREVSTALYNFACAFSNLGDEWPVSLNSHPPQEKAIAVFLSDIATRAKIAGADEVLFPFCDNTHWSKYLQKILQKNNIDVPFRFRDEPYALDLSAKGAVDKTIEKTVFGFGVIGFWEIDSSLKYRWSAEEAQKTARPSRSRTMASQKNRIDQ